MAESKSALTVSIPDEDTVEKSAMEAMRTPRSHPTSEPEIKNLIYTIRGMQVMLDSDLAMLYQVETGILNRAAKRNKNRFPEDFRFRITRDELDSLRFQIGILRGQDAGITVGRTYLPYAYTEMGVAMLSPGHETHPT